jgi:hypothetical protein
LDCSFSKSGSGWVAVVPIDAACPRGHFNPSIPKIGVILAEFSPTNHKTHHLFFSKKTKKLKTPQKHHKTPQNTINPPKKPQKNPQNLKKRIKNSSKRLKTPKIDAQIEDLIRGAVFKKAFSHGGTAEILAKNDNRPMITIGG